MKTKKLGQEPAFACTSNETFLQKGMSQRLYIAAMAMQGILSNPDPDISSLSDNDIVIFALKQADELLRRESL